MSSTEVVNVRTKIHGYKLDQNLAPTLLQPALESEESHRKVLGTVRCLIADLCQQHNGGHPGSAMGMAALGIALYKYTMRYSPLNPSFFNRDRLVLSNGHTCLWQYIFMHLVGFPAMSLEQLKTYHSAQRDSICPGHPEIQLAGIEVTTGPLGQGVANTVGLAIASKQLGATYNRPGHHLVDNMTWCVVGDGCLQEGVAIEAIQLAGHWRLDNLAILYDNNGVTCSGTVDVATSEDINARMAACGWHVVDILDGDTNVGAIVQALEQARENKHQPSFVNIRTTIGVDTNLQGQNKAHGTPLGAEGVRHLKQAYGMDPKQEFFVPPSVYAFFQDVIPKGKKQEATSEQILSAYALKFPELAKEFTMRIRGQLSKHWLDFIPPKEELSKKKTPTRISAGRIVAALGKGLSSLVLMTCDLQPATNMSWDNCTTFQHPEHKTSCETMMGNYTGRYLQCGIREHAMAAIANGLAALGPGTVIPLTSAFFQFYSYAIAGVRMGALQGLQAIHLATHDSIAIGHDGPTHQPVELPALFRAMPNLLYVRPCDEEETCGAFMVAFEAERTPTMISLSRHPLVQYPEHSDREGVKRGAYVFIEEEEADVTLIGVGAEMVFAVEARSKLIELGIKSRVISFPCQRLFEGQSRDYKESVMQYSKRKPVVVIEAFVVNGWERYADAGYSMRTFGKSLPPEDEIYGFFGFTVDEITTKVRQLLNEVAEVGIEFLRGNFRDLNGGAMSHGINIY
ncbi:hypothetical protein H2198_003808 [Neophaeococcomyces mojaviensis]|uniref:Uncharacterized protein n=1 Tax=Neophaeococcomyces mojaviensis TaxID=3383035 RepID=A0ACC3AAN3_9EURO|nr:hypothetical protein H2198_003808 [Knufia sp. JES_112]